MNFRDMDIYRDLLWIRKDDLLLDKEYKEYVELKIGIFGKVVSADIHLNLKYGFREIEDRIWFEFTARKDFVFIWYFILMRVWEKNRRSEYI